MAPVPLPSNTLCLRLCFVLRDAAAELPGRDHAAAARVAAETTRLVAPEAIAARAHVLDAGAEATLQAAGALPFDEWHAAAGRVVRLEFVYGARATLCIRVLTSLAVPVDGCTAVRLALHTLEALETETCGDGATFKMNPPFTYTLGHALRAALTAARVARDIVLAKMFPPKLTAEQVAVPCGAAAMLAYYAQEAPPLAMARTFAPRDGPPPRERYKALLPALDAWRTQSHRHGFFALLNFSPKVSPCTVRAAADLASTEARYAGIIAPPGPVPPPQAFALLNHLHSEVVFANNYGVHEGMRFTATPTAFLWDWLCMAAPVPGVGFLTINGVFLAWQRSTPADVRASAPLLEPVLGPPTGEFEQLTHWAGP